MLRTKVHPTDLASFSVGCFLLGSYQLQQLLVGFGIMKKDRARSFKTAKFSTIKERLPDAELTQSVKDEIRKKSPLYTKTGDKGMSSVRSYVDRVQYDFNFSDS